MSALALTIDALDTIETRSAQVNRRLKGGPGIWEMLWSTFFRITIGLQLRKQAKLQQEFIDSIRIADINSLSNSFLAEISSRLHRLLLINDEILTLAPSLHFYREADFRSLSDQQDDLESIAETFSMSASSAVRGQIDLWIAEPHDGTVDQNWREFVGSLRD